MKYDYLEFFEMQFANAIGNEINFDRMRQFINVLERQIEITIYIDDKEYLIIYSFNKIKDMLNLIKGEFDKYIIKEVKELIERD